MENSSYSKPKLSSTYFSPQVQVAIRLNSNESPFGLPHRWQSELSKAIDSIQFNRYPDRLSVNLRNALANYHKMSPENIYVANGSNEVLQSIYLAHCRSGKVGMFEPTYLLHSHIANIVSVPTLRYFRDESFRTDKQELDRAIDNNDLSLLLLCSPNNPTGNCESHEIIEYACSNFDGLVVVDEAYVQFSKQNITGLLKTYENLIIVRTFSKTWGSAGLRLGYCLAAPEIISQLFSVSLPYHVDAIKQIGGILALEYEDDILESTGEIIKQRNETYEFLKTLPLDVFESDSNFIMFRPQTVQSDQLFNSLIEKSILIRFLDSFYNLEPALRVTIGTRDEMARFHDVLSDCL